MESLVRDIITMEGGGKMEEKVFSGEEEGGICLDPKSSDVKEVEE